MRPSKAVRRHAGSLVGAFGAAVTVASVAGSVGTASYLARRLLTPEREQPDNVRLLQVGPDHVVLDVTEDTTMAGRYGLWTEQGRAHLRVGPVVHVDTAADRVTRQLDGIDVGPIWPGPGRWDSSYYWERPEQALDLPTQEVQVPSDIGLLPTWLIPGSSGTTPATSSRWAVLLHGRGGSREECLRAVPALNRMGITSLIPAYRNDRGAPPSPDGRYNLGLSEWRDAEAAVRFALGQGAKRVVLVGWSMGGAICLQMLDRSDVADYVESVVLDAPVIDWGNVIAHHAQLNRVPRPLGELTRGLIGARWARRLVGVHEPLDVADTDWEHRADELHHRTLIIHSVDDDFVPIGPAQALAALRPDLVRLEEWRGVSHTREWNQDPQRFEFVLTDFLTW